MKDDIYEKLSVEESDQGAEPYTRTLDEILLEIKKDHARIKGEFLESYLNNVYGGHRAYKERSK